MYTSPIISQYRIDENIETIDRVAKNIPKRLELTLVRSLCW